MTTHTEPVPPCGHGEGARHDCWYVDNRNALIPEAERLAKSRRPMHMNDRDYERSPLFTRVFMAAMEELAVKHRVVKAPVARAAA